MPLQCNSGVEPLGVNRCVCARAGMLVPFPVRTGVKSRPYAPCHTGSQASSVQNHQPPTGHQVIVGLCPEIDTNKLRCCKRYVWSGAEITAVAPTGDAFCSRARNSDQCFLQQGAHR